MLKKRENNEAYGEQLFSDHVATIKLCILQAHIKHLLSLGYTI